MTVTRTPALPTKDELRRLGRLPLKWTLGLPPRRPGVSDTPSVTTPGPSTYSREPEKFTYVNNVISLTKEHNVESY